MPLERNSDKHPANQGKVLLAAWVDKQVRDRARKRAKDEGRPFSSWVNDVLQAELVED